VRRKFKEAAEAYEVLSNDGKRGRSYDRFGLRRIRRSSVVSQVEG
jgi:DnaJ-class molecular chaperone